jgi:hypothetical protein
MAQSQSQGFRFRIALEPIDTAGDNDLRDIIRKLPDGVHEIVRDDQTSLWAAIVDGRAVDFRAFDVADNREIGIILFYEPDARLSPPTSDDLRPPRRRADAQARMADAGAYVCTANGDGGYTCWKM